jgi:hypothetical protein
MDIIATILIVLSAAAFGGIVGWFSRGRICPTILICLIAPLILFCGIAFFSHSREGYPPLPDIIFWDTIPYLFLAVPCVVGGLLMNFVAYRAKQRATNKKGELISK